MGPEIYRLILAGILCVGLLLSRAYADDLTDLSFEELLSVEVTSVAKKPQAVDEAPAAVFVISQEDIRKIGATTIPELLRFVPGLEVASLDANNTAVSARGFNARYSNKLLVLIDGRAIYQSVLSGIFWDQHMTPVEDIDRIEIIRGPGATLYGANAVNGVINIVTKHAADTLGGFATAKGGVTTVTGQGSGRFMARQGMRLGDRGAMRLYVSGIDTPSHVDVSGDPINDGTRAIQTGLRLDWEPNDRDAFTFQGDYQAREFDATAFINPGDIAPTTVPEHAKSFNVLGRWSRSWSKDNKFTAQAYIDFLERSEVGLDFEITTVDLDISHYFSLSERIAVTWGAGYRSVEDNVVTTGAILSYLVPSLRTDLFNAYVQQDISFFDEHLRVSAGSKFEHNDFTGFEIQPSIRAIWVGHDDWSVWAAISRAVRTPSRLETSFALNIGTIPPPPGGGLPIQLALAGNPFLQVEDLLAYEMGWRREWGSDFKIDINAYFQDYQNLIVITQLPPTIVTAPLGPGGAPIPVLIDVDLTTANGREGEVYGLEASVDWRPTDWWRVKLAGDVKDYNFIDTDAGAAGVMQSLSGDSPTYQVSVRSDFDIYDNLNATLLVKRVGALQESATDAYTDLDIRVGFRVTSRLEITLLAENLLKGARQEQPFVLYPAPDAEVERKISASAAVRF